MSSPPDDSIRRLRAHGMRVTSQRQAILSAFTGGRTEHLTAEEVLRRARRALPGVSRATVYGTLGEFQRAGLLGAHGRPEVVRYELGGSQHDHFRCRHCDRIYDVRLEALSVDALEAEGFVCDSAEIQLEGTCAACVAFAEGMHAGVSALSRDRAAWPAESWAIVPSPVGALLASASERGLTGLAFTETSATDPRPPASGPGDRVLAALGEQLDAYFAGLRETFDVAVDWGAVSAPALSPLRAVRGVPYGTTAIYARLVDGTEAGDVSRGLGTAVGGNPMPIVIPCHRVVRGPGELVDYSGGVERKRALLALEGASI